MDDDEIKCPNCHSNQYTSRADFPDCIVGGKLQRIYRCHKCRKDFSEGIE